MKKLVIIAIALFAFAQTYADTVNTSTGGEFGGLRNTVKQYHLTTNATTTVVSVTAPAGARLYGVTVGAVTSAGTAWTLTVTDGQGTAANFINAFAIAATTTPTFYPVPQPGILMTGGIKITTAGTTPGVLDIWVAYR